MTKAKIKVELPVLTRAELEAARLACVSCTQADRFAAEAKKQKEAALAQIFFKMGFTSLDEAKGMSPDILANHIERRVGRVFQLEAKAFAEFALQKTSQGKYPNWKNELIRLYGPAPAAQIESDTATMYSYTVIEAGAVAPGASGVFVLAPEPEVKSKKAAAR